MMNSTLKLVLTGMPRRSVIAGVFTVIIEGTYLVSLGSLFLLDGAAFFPRLW